MLNIILSFATNTLDLYHRYIISLEPNMFERFYFIFSPSLQNYFNKGMEHDFYHKGGHIAPGSL